jgi:membrane-bound lytic murein transglycosylase D
MSIGRLRVSVAVVGLAALLTAGCQSAQRPAPLLPNRQASAPPLAPIQHPGNSPANQPNSDSSTIVPQAEAKSDPVVSLIEEVEKEYQVGEENYKADHLEAAKENFDRAFNLLLESPLEIRSDERLQTEFDRLLDRVNGLELEALQQGDGFTEQKSEPAPIDEANDVTYPVDAGIKAKAEAEVKETHSDLPLMLTDPVASYIAYFSTRGRGTLESALVRGGRYQEMIQRVLKEEGVPQDLIYLAQAESGFHPLAVSHAGARGMWQFMATRARGYGLQRSWWVDERQDPEKATRAAARHLKDLYNEFGDWYLAMAAYNSGPGTVQNAVKRTGYADYWELYKRNVLPKETRNYVPIILAVTIMAKNPIQYGLQDVIPEKPVPYEAVKIDYPVDLRLVAECVDVSASTLQDLNPSLLRWTTPKDQDFELHLPAGTKDRYLAAISEIPTDMRVWWRYHSIAPGDNLASVAHFYHTSAKSIAEANGISEDEQLSTDSKLIIPVTPGRHLANEEGATYSRYATKYKVRRGDTVQRVADNFGVPAAMVRHWNHLKGNSLGSRHFLYIHLPVAPGQGQEQVASNSKSRKASQTSSTTVRHKVQPGETLYSIAKSHNTTVDALKQTNGNLATLRPGMILLITPAER